MGKTALVFPGQGSQYTGMAKDLYEGNETAKKIIDLADSVLDFDLKKMMFCEEMSEELSKTENTQPAMVAHSIAALEALKEIDDIKFDACLGLSLGEYAALTAAGAMKFEDAIKLVRKRGKLMAETVPAGVGAMAAVIGFDREIIEKTVDLVTDGVVEVANYNSPAQIVISGEDAAVEKAIELLKEAGAKKVIKLNVSGPFHSSMLKEAGEKLEKELENVEIVSPKVSVVANVNAKYYGDNPKELLVKQVYSSVMWEDSISMLMDEGFDRFIEIGPGKTLKGFIRKIGSKKGVKPEIINIDTLESLEQFR